MGILSFFRRRQKRWGKIIHQALVRDWRFMENETVPEAESDRYRIKIEASQRDQQYFITCVNESKPYFGADIFIEINGGVPCLHISNVINGDNVLHLFFTDEGIAVVPEVDTERPIPVSTSRYYPGSQGFSPFYNNPADTDIPDGLVA